MFHVDLSITLELHFKITKNYLPHFLWGDSLDLAEVNYWSLYIGTACIWLPCLDISQLEFETSVQNDELESFASYVFSSNLLHPPYPKSLSLAGAFSLTVVVNGPLC
jgi:hypothetical protein